MVPILQRILDDHRGDCFKCCLASILEKDYDQVPDVTAGSQDWDLALDDYLRPLGVHQFSFYLPDHRWLDQMWMGFNTHFILSGPSPRSQVGEEPRWHAVVGITRGWGVDIAFDPHPEGSGLRDGERWLRFFMPGATIPQPRPGPTR